MIRTTLSALAARSATVAVTGHERASAADDGFVPDDIPIGAPGFRYHDPEFLPGGQLAVHFTDDLDIWLGELDPITGMFASGHGQDVLVASDTWVGASATARPSGHWRRS